MQATDASSSRAASICLALGLLGALPLVLLTPPLQVADEFQHFARAYQLSEGRLWGHAEDGDIGDDLPSSLADFARRFLGSTQEHTDRTLTRQPLLSTLAERAHPLDPDSRGFVGFRGAVLYSPLPYLPQIVGIRVARMANAGPLMLLYAGRLANALAAVALLAAAVRITPVARYLVAVAGLLPMTLYQDASLSPDAMIIGCAFLFTALALRSQWLGRWSAAGLATAIVAGTVFCSVKPVYAPLLLVGLVPDVFRRDRMGRWLLVYGLIVVSVVAATWLWMRSSVAMFAPARPGTNVHDQAAFVLAHPIDYAKTMAATLGSNSAFYYRSMIGQFGWLTIRPPLILQILPPLTAIVAAVDGRSERAQIPNATAVWQLALALSCIPLILTSLYLIWTPVGSAQIEGVQGRYFLPVLAAVAIAFGRLFSTGPEDRPFASGGRGGIIGALLVTQIAVSDLTIASAYAIF